MRNAYKILAQNSEEKRHLGNPGMGARIMLKRNLKK
jgi:hypothetical protein